MVLYPHGVVPAWFCITILHTTIGVSRNSHYTPTRVLPNKRIDVRGTAKLRWFL